MESGLNSAGPLTAGKPATRHIMLIADGLSAAQLPPIELELPQGLKQYPEHPYDRDQVLKEGISGSRHVAITLVATEPGSYTLPALDIPWWNTETDREETARLPALTLQVAPGEPGFSPAQTPQSFALPSEQTQTPFVDLEESWKEPHEEDDSGGSWLVWFLAAGWLITLLGWWRSVQRKRSKAPPSPASPDVPPPQAADTKGDIIEALASAYRVTNQESARRAWLRWGEYVWPENPPSNLSRLAERCSPKIARAVLALDKAIYSPAHEFDWVKYSPRELLEQDAPLRTDSSRRDKLASV